MESSHKHDASDDQDFDNAFKLLQSLVEFSDASELFPKRANAVYTASVVLWMLVYQRLKPDASLEAAVKHLIETKPDYLPNIKRVQQKTLSTNSTERL